MKRLRFCSLALLLWLAAFYNVERLHAPINIASFAYVFAALAGAATLAVPGLPRVSLPWLLALPVCLFLGCKAWLGYRVVGAALPFTVTEISAVTLTMLLARQIALALDEFEDAVATAVVDHLNQPATFEAGQAAIYREIRRARIHERPLALFAVGASHPSAQAAANRLLEEVQQAMLGKYLSARIADVLSKATKDCAIVTARDDHFVAVLPETSREQAAQLVAHLKNLGRHELDLNLHIGWSTFPDEEVTLDQLLERATRQMRRGLAEPDLAPTPAAGSRLLTGPAESTAGG